MEKETEKKNFLVDTIKGLPLGVSAAVPGVSAGTIAIIERCYDRIINSIADLKKSFKANFLSLLPFLLGYLIGGALALLAIKKGYEVAPFSLTGLFAGFIIGSLPSITVELHKGSSVKEKVCHIVPMVICFAVASLLGILSALYKLDLTAAMEDHSWWIYPYVFLAGALGAGACLVPGVSGSMCLMVMGLYIPLLGKLIGSGSFFMNGDVLNGVIVILVLLFGAIAGLIVASKGMKYLLAKHRTSTFYAIFGLILGSLVSMFMNSSIYPIYLDASHPLWDYIVGASLLIGGALLTYFLIKFSNKKQN